MKMAGPRRTGFYKNPNLKSKIFKLEKKYCTVALIKSASSNVFLKIFENFKGLF